jgi:hypothetical protein
MCQDGAAHLGDCTARRHGRHSPHWQVKEHNVEIDGHSPVEVGHRGAGVNLGGVDNGDMIDEWSGNEWQIGPIAPPSSRLFACTG